MYIEEILNLLRQFLINLASSQSIVKQLLNKAMLRTCTHGEYLRHLYEQPQYSQHGSAIIFPGHLDLSKGYYHWYNKELLKITCHHKAILDQKQA
jgi:hypothetical protein